jgi:large subunit ribosomal protein L25
MSDIFELSAELRQGAGKGASRRLRREGKVPAILYGGGGDPVSLTLLQHEIKHQLDHEAFYSHVLTIKAGDKKQKAILRDVQRHPYKPILLHLDFLRIQEDTAIRVNVPLHYVNEEASVGIKKGAVVTNAATDVEVECLPKHLPEYIEVDLAEVDVGETLHLTDLKLPEGVQLVVFISGDEQENDLPIASMQIPRVVTEEDEESEEGLEGEGEPEDEDEF